MTAPENAKSLAAHERAIGLMPGGVSSPVRAYQAVDRSPIYIAHGSRAVVTDLDGHDYVDYVGSYGPLILGHAPPGVADALRRAIDHGTTFGMPTQGESTLAELIVKAIPSVQRVRFVNSGTEATMSAIRLARAATARQKVIKFAGCYHGHSDGLLVQAGSGATTLGIPSSPGVPLATTEQTLVLPYNDPQAVREAFSRHSRTIAAVIVEPIAGNMGCVKPREGYLRTLRELCDQHEAVLIFDEVMTGFRVGYGGAQSLYGIEPDLTCLGKVIGGGLPCAAYGGREDLMAQVAPQGPVYQAGTLSGNPLAMAAGIATLEALQQPGVYEALDTSAARLAEGLGLQAAQHSVAVQVSRVGSMACVFFTEQPVTDYDSALRCDTRAFATFFNAMLDRGVILPPSQFETWFVSTAHDQGLIDQTIAAAGGAFARVAAQGVAAGERTV